MLIVALVARAAQFGNPVVQVDDQFYLLVGERMWHGELPYVDHWDRKPVGLFLIYAAVAKLGDGVLASQLLAALSVAATGYVIARIARHIADPHGAAAAGVLYILCLGMLGGDGGQSPVFYNLPVALAMLAAVKAFAQPGFTARHFALGLGATALMGVAMQIKYTALFEGAFIGCVFMAKAWRAELPRVRIAAMAAVWLAAGLLPTALAWGWYVSIGHGLDFFHANFVSIFARQREPAFVLSRRLLWIAAWLGPLALTAAFAQISTLRAGSRASRELRLLLAAWPVAAIAGFLVFGSYFDHYALPLIGPLAVAAAPALGTCGARLAVLTRRGNARSVPLSVMLMAFATAASAAIINENRRIRGWGPQADAIADYVRPRLKGGMLYVFQGDPALYRLTDTRMPTRWTFPDHISQWREQGATGADTLVELRHILSLRPRFVVNAARPSEREPRILRVMQASLERDYRPVLVRGSGGNDSILYARRDGG